MFHASQRGLTVSRIIIRVKLGENENGTKMVRIPCGCSCRWAVRHARPDTLSLSGPAGGTWGGRGENITMDAFDFCRTVSGRGPATGLLSQQVPF
jgi:hypothetical protein